MPTYAYRCGTCGHQFEVFAKMSDPAPEACESCSAKTLEKVMFPVAVHYKGSGFYSTDYSSPRSESASTSGESSGESSSSSETSSSSSGSDGSASSSSGSGSETGPSSSPGSGSSDA